MLKIKDEMWGEFCEKAEELGFDKFLSLGYDRKDFCLVYPKGTYKEHDCIREGEDCLIINASSLGYKSEHEIVLTFSNMLGSTFVSIAQRKQYDKLFELFELGYVEKI